MFVLQLCCTTSHQLLSWGEPIPKVQYYLCLIALEVQKVPLCYNTLPSKESWQEADRELSGEPFMAGCGGCQVILEF